MGDEINKVINNIADKLNVGVSEILPAYARYKIANGVFYILVPSILLILWLIFSKWVGLLDKDDDEYYSNLLPVICFSMIFIIIIIVGVYDVTVWSIAPEGAFVKEILKVLKGD